MRGCETCGRFAGARGRAGCGVFPGSSIRRRIVGGTNRPWAEGGAWLAASGVSAAGGSATGSSTGAGGASSTSAVGAAACTGSATGAGTGTCGSATGGASSATGGTTGASGGGAEAAAGLTVFTRRGGPNTGADGFGGSGFFAAGVFLLPFAGAGWSANMSPLGSEIPRWRATRSTNERATTSSIVLDALFSSMPCSFFRSASTSWLVVSSSSATL